MQFDDMATTDGVDNPTLDIDTNGKNDTVWNTKDEHGNELKVFKDPQIFSGKPPSVQLQEQQEEGGVSVAFHCLQCENRCLFTDKKNQKKPQKTKKKHYFFLLIKFLNLAAVGFKFLLLSSETELRLTHPQLSNTWQYFIIQ